MERGGSVYIMTNKNKTTLYVGVTSNLRERVTQHKEHFYKKSFSDNYNLEFLVYYENLSTLPEAFQRDFRQPLLYIHDGELDLRWRLCHGEPAEAFPDTFFKRVWH